MENNTFKKILVVRTDKIGDVLLTLPTVHVLKKHFPDAKISMLVSSYTSNIVENLAPIHLYTNLENKPRPFFELYKELHKECYDAAVVAYPRFKIVLLLWLVGIPIRVGTGYRLYSFLFNKKVYEHRKTVQKHEAEYNLSLLKKLNCNIEDKPTNKIILTDDDKAKAFQELIKLGLNPNDNIIMMHPGSGGSAHCWKPENFAMLAQELISQNYKVIITGGNKEKTLVNYIVDIVGNKAYKFISDLSLREFAAFITFAKIFIANSTGPLHMAAAVNSKVIGFYPPIKVMSPQRWGPLTEQKIIFVPNSDLCDECKNGKCKSSKCMDQIKPEQVVEAVKTLLKES